MNSAVMFSKASDEWRTPWQLFQPLHREFGFGLDAAATYENKLTTRYLYDALRAEWHDAAWGHPIWLNPPYSKCRAFIAKAAQEAQKGATVVCLVPSRTDTRWWHEHVWDAENHRQRPGVEVRFIKGRIVFLGADGQPMRDSKGRVVGAPFPSVVIVFRPPQAAV